MARKQEPEPLTPMQRQAVRLELAGSNAGSIAAACGVSQQTVSKWRKMPEYRRRLNALIDASDQDAREAARLLRLEAGKVLRRAVLEANLALDDENVDVTEMVSLLRLVLDVYRATSSQTGLGEVSKHEVTVSAPEKALAELRQMITVVDDATLRAIEEK